MKLRIEKAIYGGDGLARVPEGKTVFVPGTLPGELVEVTIASDKRSFATGALDGVLEPSPERILPGCAYVPRCGGCQYQHASPGFQLQLKLDILKETLTRAHLPMPSEIGSVAGPPWGYRNRIRLHVKGDALAYRQRGSHNLLRVTHCPIAAPLLEQAIAAVERIAKETALASLCEEVEFFSNGEQDQLLVSLWSEKPRRVRERSLETFAERLRVEIPVLTGVGLWTQQSSSIMHWGQRSLTYTVSGVPYQVSLGSFFQVNRFLVPELLQLAIGNRSGRLAWDLYSGVGLFAQALAYENVIAVESEGFSADDLKTNSGNKQHRVVRSNTLDFLRGPVPDQEKPELILVDPPRAGLGKDICALLADVAAPEIVYVSCDPATLARDLQSLLQSGYSVERMDLIDLFPQTFHMETVTFLKRN
jgi:23S rRNA (uracil1939-C5)-methyltransferase